MNSFNQISAKLSNCLLCTLFLMCFYNYAYSNEIEDLYRKNISNLKVSDFEWKTSLQSTQPIFKLIEIKNNSDISFKDIELEIQIYNDSDVLYKFPIIINDSIKKSESKKYENVTGNILLPFTPIRTEVAIKNAKIDFSSSAEFDPAKNIIIQDVEYIIDSSASKTISFQKLSYKNISRSFYGDIRLLVSVFDQNNNLISEELISNNQPISPGETISLAPLTIGVSNSSNATSISITLMDANIISPKTYMSSGGKMKNIKIEDIYQDIDSKYDEIPIANDDLRILDFNWKSKARNTQGIIILDLFNDSLFDYSDIIFEIYFLNQRGNTVNKRRFKHNPTIEATKKTKISVNAGIMDFDFSNIQIAIKSAEPKINLKAKKLNNVKTDRESPKTIKDVTRKVIKQEMTASEITESIIILDYDISSNIGFFRLMNLLDEDISEVYIKLENTSNKEKIIKLKMLRARAEKKYLGIDLEDLLGGGDKIISITITKAFK